MANMNIVLRRILPLLLMLACFCQPARALTPADQAEIQQFSLSDAFIKKYLVLAAEGRAHPQDRVLSDPKEIAKATASLDALAAKASENPEAVAAIKRQGLTPREYLVGMFVIMRAAMADYTMSNPSMARYADPSKQPSAASMAVYRAHKEEIMKAAQQGAAQAGDGD